MDDRPKVALTGGIGSGKSYVAKRLEAHGVHVFDCDKSAKRLMNSSPKIKEELTALVGSVAGYFMGFGFAQLIGHSVFGSAVEMKPMVIPIVAALIALVTIAGSMPAIRMVLRLRPAEVLHGGH